MQTGNVSKALFSYILRSLAVFSNFYDGFNVVHKGLKIELIVALKHESDTKKVELVEPDF